MSLAEELLHLTPRNHDSSLLGRLLADSMPASTAPLHKLRYGAKGASAARIYPTKPPSPPSQIALPSSRDSLDWTFLRQLTSAPPRSVRWRPTAPVYLALRGAPHALALAATCRPLLLLQSAAVHQPSLSQQQVQRASLRTAAAVADRPSEQLADQSEPATVEVCTLQRRSCVPA